MTDYTDKVTSGLIQYLPLTEITGTTANDDCAENNDGTYSGVTLNAADFIIPHERVGLWDGTNDFVNLYSAALASDFNGPEGSLVVWAKVASAGVWTDGALRRAVRLAVDANNSVYISKMVANNTIQVLYQAGGTSKLVNITASATDWFHVVLTWNKASDRVRAYYNGTQSGTTQTGLGVWAGALSDTQCAVGANNNAGGSPWSGYLSHYRLYNRELTAAEVASLAVIDTNYGLEILVSWDGSGAYTGNYDNITGDVVQTQDISFSNGYAPYKFVAEESLLSFAVNNESGKYSPENSGGILYGDLKTGRPMQVRYQGTPIWTGLLRGLRLVGQQFSLDRVAIFEAISQKEKLDRYPIYPDLHENVTADDVISDTAALVGLGTDLNTGHLPLRFVGDLLQSREELDTARRAMSAYELFDELMKAERGWIYFKGDGSLAFRSRYALIGDTVPDYIFDNRGVPSYITSIDEMTNRFQVTYFPRVASDAATDILWQNEDSIHIPAGTTRTIVALFQDENRKAIGAKDVQTPSGTDLVYSTGTATLSITKRAQRAELTFNNSGGGVDAIISTLIVRGRTIRSSYPAETYSEDAASIADVGLRLQSETIRVLDNENDAFAIAELELDKRSNIPGRVESLVLPPQKADGTLYSGKYTETETTGLIQYLQLDESSGSTANDTSAENNDGTYSSVTLGAATSPIQPDKAPSFNGTSSHVNVYSAALNTDFDELLGTLVIWVKVSAVGVWTDSTVRAVAALGADANNYITIYRPTTSNQLVFEYKAGGSAVSRTVSSLSSTEWMCLAITWNKTSNRARAYIDGVQQGADVTGLGVWAGALGAAACTVGAFNTGANFWSGYLSHYRLYNAELTAAQVLTLASDEVCGFLYNVQDLVKVIDDQDYHERNYHITRMSHQYSVADKMLSTTLELEPAFTASLWVLGTGTLGTAVLAY